MDLLRFIPRRILDREESRLGESVDWARYVLDEVIPRVQQALYDAPQDPVLSQYYQATYEARETTLRQLGRSLPVVVRLTGY